MEARDREGVDSIFHSIRLHALGASVRNILKRPFKNLNDGFPTPFRYVPQFLRKAFMLRVYNL